MYSSGTTGAPKCMVHSVGGTLLKHLEEHVVQGNRDNTDVLLYYTTTGQIRPDYTELYTSCIMSLQKEVRTSRWLKPSSKIERNHIHCLLTLHTYNPPIPTYIDPFCLNSILFSLLYSTVLRVEPQVLFAGWMMWNWEVTALSAGCSLVLYDGSPLHPHNAVMWDLVDACAVTVFGTSAKWIGE
jgi:hypothetical protein